MTCAPRDRNAAASHVAPPATDRKSSPLARYTCGGKVTFSSSSIIICHLTKTKIGGETKASFIPHSRIAIFYLSTVIQVSNDYEVTCTFSSYICSRILVTFQTKQPSHCFSSVCLCLFSKSCLAVSANHSPCPSAAKYSKHLRFWVIGTWERVRVMIYQGSLNAMFLYRMPASLPSCLRRASEQYFCLISHRQWYHCANSVVL